MPLAAPRPTGPRTLGDRERAATVAEAEFRAAVDSRQVRWVQLLLPDPHARFVAVELGAEFVRDVVLARGYGACTYVLAWDVHREPVETLTRYLGRYGDFSLVPDLATLHPVPGRPDTCAIICDAAWPEGAVVDLAPRQFLRAQLSVAQERGLVPSVGLEHEVTCYDAAGQPLTAHGIDYARHTNRALDGVLTGIRAALDESALNVESARAECHPGQYEIVLAHRDALAACDDAMLLQHLVRTAAAEHGATASYLAAEAPGRGSSCHVHLSLSTTDLEPINADSGLPTPLARFLAGVLAAARSLTAIWAPTVNSYVRLRTAPFSPRVLGWGYDDRTRAVRVAGRDTAQRLEFRFAGADAQPHLVVAALLAAGLAGIDQELPLPPANTALGELASTPWAALAELTDSRRPAELLGQDRVDQLAALLGTELDSLCDTVSDVQRARGALRI